MTAFHLSERVIWTYCYYCLLFVWILGPKVSSWIFGDWCSAAWAGVIRVAPVWTQHLGPRQHGYWPLIGQLDHMTLELLLIGLNPFYLMSQCAQNVGGQFLRILHHFILQIIAQYCRNIKTFFHEAFKLFYFMVWVCVGFIKLKSFT